MSKQFVSIARKSLLSSCAAGAVALLVSTGTAQAAVVSCPPMRAASAAANPTYSCTLAPFETEGQPEDVVTIAVQDAAGNAAVFSANQEEDVVFLEPDAELAPTPCSQTEKDAAVLAPVVLDSPGVAHLNRCVSDVLRIVNVGGTGQMWFASDGATAADLATFATTAAFTGAHTTAVLQELPAPNIANKISVDRTINVGAQSASVRFNVFSDTNTLVSDQVRVLVPALSPVSLIGMGALLLVLGGAFVARRRKPASDSPA